MILSTSLILSIASPTSSPFVTFKDHNPPQKETFVITINQVDDFFSRPSFMRELNVIREEPSIERLIKKIYTYEKKNNLFGILSK